MKAVGIVGLGTMGLNLGLNFRDQGIKTYGYDLDKDKVSQAKDNGIEAYPNLRQLIDRMTPMRVLIVLVPANYVDDVLEALNGLLDPQDIVIDGGNSNWKDTERRLGQFTTFRFIGMGISGGAEGARHGPSLMVGGNEKSYGDVEQLLKSIAATFEGTPCCEWMGAGSAGHFVKMVHNGIEYADMELIAEVYDFLRRSHSNEEIAEIFSKWNKGPLQSFLLEASANILREKNGLKFIVDEIIDEAGQKGTGKWTAINALEFGVPLSVIGSAVNQRFNSSFRHLRIDLSETYPKGKYRSYEPEILHHLEKALLFGRIMAYAEGLHLLKEADKIQKWCLNLTAAVRVWRAGCIIRSRLLHTILRSLEDKPDHLLQSIEVFEIVRDTLPSTSLVLQRAIAMGIPMPSLSNAFESFCSLISPRLPANLIQAQRDYFGSHGFKTFAEPDRVSHWQWKREQD